MVGLGASYVALRAAVRAKGDGSLWGLRAGSDVI